MIPEMNKEGYDRNFSAAIMATASTTGFLIPPSNLLIIYAVVSGGILGGLFTATEAGAVAVIYAFMLAVFVFREVKIADFVDILLRSAESTAIVMFLIGTSIAMSWLLAYENVPAEMASFLMGLSDNPLVILLLINLLLLAVGIFMNLTIGLCAPPVGSILFVSCAVAKTSIGKIVRPMMPMHLALFVALVPVTCVPAISEFLHKFFGLID